MDAHTADAPRRRTDHLLAGLAVAYAALALLGLLTGAPRTTGQVAVGAGATLVLAGCVVLARRAPLTTLVTGSVAVALQAAAGASAAISPAATLVPIVAAGRLPDPRRAVAGLAVTAAGVVAYYVASPPSTITEPIATLAAYTGFWAVARAWRLREHAVERAERAERERLLADLRTGLAQDLHDVVGHALNVVVVHAGAARLSLDGAPETSRALLLQVEEVGRSALEDLDDAVDALRAGPLPARGSSGVSQLEALARRFDGSGVRVDLDVDPALTAPPTALPRALDVVAHRTVLEALTNALEHAAPCTARVAVHLDADAVVVEVSDDGAGPRTGWRHGRGLAGIVDRVERAGGTVEIGPAPPTADVPSGFRVSARIPVSSPVCAPVVAGRDGSA